MSLVFLVIYIILAFGLSVEAVLFRPRKTYFEQNIIRTNQQLPDLSIIICARNEHSNLQKHLPFILNQKYDANWEVIVVDDGSTDDSYPFLIEIQKNNPHLKIVRCLPHEKLLPGKKNALQLGIKNAQFNWILLTDADCKPASIHWAALMAQVTFNPTCSIIAGFGNYNYKKGLLNKYIRYQTLQTLMQYSGMAAIGLPYMGVGRNLMYQKPLWQEFEKNPNFWKKYTTTIGGDDDLFIANVATKLNYTLQLTADAHTFSEPKTTWRDWWRQRQRHVDAGKLYPFKINFTLAMMGLANGFFWLLTIIGICSIAFLPINIFIVGLFALIVRWGIYLFWNHKWHKYLEIQEKWYNDVLLNLLDSVIQLITMIFANANKTKRWK